LLLGQPQAEPCPGGDGRGGGGRNHPRQPRARDSSGGRGLLCCAVAGDCGQKMTSRFIYLDNQATTPLAPDAREAMLPWLAGPEAPGLANPHSPHRPGRAAAAAVEAAREQVAALLPPGGRVISTSGATEAINLAVFGRRH